MKANVEIIIGEGLCAIKPSDRAITGPLCSKTAKTTSGGVTNAKNIPQYAINPAEQLSSIGSPYLFMKYSMDIVRPLPRTSGQRKYMLILTDYFHKVGRSRSICGDKGFERRKLRMEEHNL